jgi:hypothetical protein
MEPDFSGWATKANLRCSDGRTITPDAFKHMDGQTVPLVWQHAHSEPANVLGKATLTHTSEGVRADCYFNNSATAQTAKELVEHGDIRSLSIYANQLIEKAKAVMHGMIREVSLVMSGANPGAYIDQVTIRHADGDIEELEGEAVISMMEELFHADGGDDSESDDELTIQDVYDSMTPEQQDVVTYLVSAAVEATQEPGDEPDDSAEHSNNNSGEDNLSHKGGAAPMTRNVFDQTSTGSAPAGKTLTHAQTAEIFELARKNGGVSSLRDLINEYAITHNIVKEGELQHGITPMDVLFPNFTNLDNTPQFLSRRMEWVEGVLNGCSKTPFSSVRSIVADITQESARALGYIKGNYKKEEWFSVTKRTTTATTVIKKQKLDRDDIIDITDFDVVAWMKVEMMVMFREELARAILIGDGREVDDPDKIKDPSAATSGAGIRSIINEHELYKTDVFVNLDDASSSYEELVEAVMRSMRFYKGTGSPVFYTTLPILSNLLLIKDGFGRRLYNSKADLASAMMVSDIIPVEVMETLTDGTLGIIVNLSDYNIGANRGGETSLFDFFDIDYNQYKYLVESRISGALTKVKSALVVKKTASSNVLATPTKPGWVKSTGVVTIPTITGVVYKNSDTNATLTAGAQTALTSGQFLNVVAVPASGYFFETDGLSQKWNFSVGSSTSE